MINCHLSTIKTTPFFKGLFFSSKKEGHRHLSVSFFFVIK